jgi:hypothetical protein
VTRARLGAFVAAGLVVAAAVAFFVSPWASSRPDGLIKVAHDQRIDTAVRHHALRGSPTAGYRVRGIDDGRLSKGVAGLLGVGVTFAVAGGTVLLLRRRRPSETG